MPTAVGERSPGGYRNLGDVVEFAELNAIYLAIAAHKDTFQIPNGNMLFTKKFKGGTLYAVDHKGIRYMEQNPNTGSAYAKKSQEGAKIVWVIRLREGGYLGYIEDGIVWMQ